MGEQISAGYGVSARRPRRPRFLRQFKKADRGTTYGRRWSKGSVILHSTARKGRESAGPVRLSCVCFVVWNSGAEEFVAVGWIRRAGAITREKEGEKGEMDA